MPYPTPEEIVAFPPPKFKKSTIEHLRAWNRVRKILIKTEDADGRIWDESSVQRILLLQLARLYGKPVRVIFKKRYAYSIDKRTIMIGEKPSIISALHEFGHHLFGSSELKACRWSVWLFKKAFPKAFTKLKFKGHLLIVDQDMI